MWWYKYTGSGSQYSGIIDDAASYWAGHDYRFWGAPATDVPTVHRWAQQIARAKDGLGTGLMDTDWGSASWDVEKWVGLPATGGCAWNVASCNSTA